MEMTVDVPEKFHKALIRAVDLCAVKKHLGTPPEIRVYAKAHSGDMA